MKQLIKKKLTLIIPFLNEKDEVEKTLQSIREHSCKNEIEIILINDASDDGYNYELVSKKYRVNYIVNEKRLGVAASRDLGIALCQTPYFLLLDAHMRFYNNIWVRRIIMELDSDKRTLLCCQTKSLKKENGLLIEKDNRIKSYGACVELHKGEHWAEPFWIFHSPDKNEHEKTISIVCVLGAGYACNKEYWQYLKGLEGLKYYGNDETYISIKVWLEGGTCKLLNDVEIGHIYRPKFPYPIIPMSRLYNRLLICYLLLPVVHRKKILSQIKFFQHQQLPKVFLLLHDHHIEIAQLKDYYKKIFTRNFSFFEEINHKAHKQNRPIDDTNKILNDIANRIEQEPIIEIGLHRGCMGIIIFLFHYALFSKKNKYKVLAEQMLENLLENIKEDTHYAFATGLSGIGWSIEYLFQNGFLEGNTSEILEDFDKKMVEINPLRVFSLNRDYGFAGIVQYLLARLYTIEHFGFSNNFDENYLKSVYEKIQNIIDTQDTACDYLDILLEFLYYYEHKQSITKPEIYDVWCLLNPGNIPLQDLDLGLIGAVGVGLKLILDQQNK